MDVNHELTFDVKETVRIEVKTGNKRVVHTLKPPTLSQLNLFERKRNSAVKISKITGEVDQDVKAETEAMLYLYDLLADKVDGYAMKNWQSKVPVLQKISAVKALFTNHIVTEEYVRTNYGSQYVKESENHVIYMISLYNNNLYYLTSHQLKEPGLSEFLAFQAIQQSSRTALKKNKIIVQPALTYERYSRLYDSLFVEGHGYSDNSFDSIPVLHKREIILDFFSSVEAEVEEVRGN